MTLLLLIMAVCALLTIVGMVIWSLWFDKREPQSMIDTLQSISSGGHNHQCEDNFISGVVVGVLSESGGSP